MKIKRVKFYQGVEINKTLVNFVTPDMDSGSGVRTNSPKFTITRTDDGVLVEGGMDPVEVFKTNIAYITYEKAEPAVKKVK